MKLLTSFLLVLITGVMVSLYLAIPFLKPSVAPNSDVDVRVLKASFLINPIVSSFITVLFWVMESSLASFIIRRSRKGEGAPSLALVMREFSIAYSPSLIFSLIITPYIWFYLPESTVTTVDEFIRAARYLGSYPLYVSGMIALIMVSLSHHLIYIFLLRFRLEVRWKVIAIIILSLLLVEALIALWMNFNLRWA